METITSDPSAAKAIMYVVGFCIVLIFIIVSIKFLMLPDDVRRIRKLLEDQAASQYAAPKIHIDSVEK